MRDPEGAPGSGRPRPRGQPVRALAGRILLPIQQFVATEASSGLLLLAAAAVAVAWANSPWKGSYADFWGIEFAVEAKLFHIEESLGQLVNDGLMATFFFVVGLEIKRELLHGELASPRRAALPVAAAIGGMVVPAGIYAAWNAGGAGTAGWGIPMATDIAFALGVLAVLGRRAPFNLKVFLLGLAIVDDLGAIAVIAVFYTDSLSFAALALAVGFGLATVMALRAGLQSPAVYLALGIGCWAATLESGIHATLAGVALAMLVPSQAAPAAEKDERAFDGLLDDVAGQDQAGDEATLDRLERMLHPWVSYLVVPIFALANAGVRLSGDQLADAAGGAVAAGVFFGLVVGKPVGIITASLIVTRMGIATLPAGVRLTHIAGAAILGGIGFTVSLFVTALAFDDSSLVAEAKVAVFAASLVAGAAGFVYLWIAPGEEEIRAANGQV